MSDRAASNMSEHEPIPPFTRAEGGAAALGVQASMKMRMDWRETAWNKPGPPLAAIEQTSSGVSMSRYGSEVNAVDFAKMTGRDPVQAMKQRPRRIFLVRHAESQGNTDESIYTRVPDSKVPLTERGKEQAETAGRKIREMIEADGAADWRVYFYVSPYLRSLQTMYGIGRAFDRDRIVGVREEPRLREQDFSGSWQDAEEMLNQKKVRERYGRFFYRFPNGESAADVYDRVTGFRETIMADIEVGRFQRPEYQNVNMNIIIVTHGITARVLLMRWFKWTVEQFEQVYNPGNAEFLVLSLGTGGRYSLRIHHTREELAQLGVTEECIDDQEFQITADPGELNYNWHTDGASFFDRFEEIYSVPDGENVHKAYPSDEQVSHGPDFFSPNPAGALKG